MSTEIKAKAQATVTKPTKLSDFASLFGKYQLQIEQIAPKKGIQANRIIALAAQVFATTPTLHNCDPSSMVAAVMQCAMMGLNPTPQWGEIYFVPYNIRQPDGSWKSMVQMQMGYQGWLKLAYKSGVFQSVNAFAVYQGDHYKAKMGTVCSIDHEAGPNYGNPALVTDAYAIGKLKNGGEVMVMLNRMLIERLRLKSPMQKADKDANGAWKNDYDKMAMAKAIKQLMKLVPREDEWRSFDFVDESIARLDAMSGDGPTDFQYPAEGSAEVVAAEPTEEEKNQAVLEKELAKDQNSGGGTLPFQG